MADIALENANINRNQLLKQKKDLQEQVKSIDLKLDRIEAFISDWHAFSEGRIDDVVDKSSKIMNKTKTVPKIQKKFTGNSKKEEVAKATREIIATRGKPVSRDDLYSALIHFGYKIDGADPLMVLSTMLWRMSDEVVRLKSGGYWLPERPYDPAGYDPEAERELVRISKNIDIEEMLK